VFWSLIILTLSILPGKSIPKAGWKLFFHSDKVAHFAIYFVLAGLFVFGYMKYRTMVRKRDLFLVMFVCSMYGILMELLQYFFLSDRSFEIHDIIANIIGSTAGTIFVYLFLKRKEVWI